MKKLHLLFITALFLIAGPTLAQVQISDAYARGTAASGAVFLIVTNPDATDDKLLSVTSTVAQMTQLHTSTMDANGVMTMSELSDGVVIPAAGSHDFARGGDHIMLMGLTDPMKDGDTLRLTLMFERAGAVDVDVVVDNKRLK